MELQEKQAEVKIRVGVCLCHGRPDQLQWKGAAMSLEHDICQKISEHQIQWSSSGPALTGFLCSEAGSSRKESQSELGRAYDILPCLSWT